MKVCVFLNGLGLGGTERAACRWAIGLAKRGHSVSVISMSDGPRRQSLDRARIDCQIASTSQAITAYLDALAPDVIHAHTPGYPQKGDVLGQSLSVLPKIPVVETNVFGCLENPDDLWTDFRLFISWTSCVQAARRSGETLDGNFFRRKSVASYPLDPDDGPSPEEVARFRTSLNIRPNEIVFGRLSRP
jgi:hypothetical protein